LDPHVIDLMNMCQKAAGISARLRCAEVTLFLDGVSKFNALEQAIREARHHLHLEYYIWEPDQTGTWLRDELRKKAAEGLEVRVLVDGLGASKTTQKFWQPLRAAGGRVAYFNQLSFSRWHPRMVNFRTHRKLVICDGTTGFIGGMNITDSHTARFSAEAAWRDTHLKLEGAAVKGLQLVFEEDWAYATDQLLEDARYHPTEKPCTPQGASLVQIISSGPDEKYDAIHKLFFSSITTARQRVMLTTPYFVPDDAILLALITARLRGAEVQILVPSSGDLPIVAAAARSYYPELLAAGIRIYEYGPPVLHAKTLVVDNTLAIVGTANTDNRSFKLNFEVVAACYDASLCEHLAVAFSEDLRRAREVTITELRAMPYSRRFVCSLARTLSPLF
jgi:cardiolipin synthase